MFPPGHIALAYVAAKLARREVSLLGFGFLAAGVLFPTFSNIAIRNYLPIYNLWSHSPVVAGALWVGLGLLILSRIPGRYRSLVLLFNIGFTAHLAADPFLDMVNLYFGARTDDVGQSWLFPLVLIEVRNPRLDPGFIIWPWRVGLELIFLSATAWHWTRHRVRRPSTDN